SAVLGVDAYLVEVEVDVARGGLFAFVMVGLPDAAVKESASRVAVALRSQGYRFPGTRVLVNLAPADVRKEGPAFDLPIAIEVLSGEGKACTAEDVGATLADPAWDIDMGDVRGQEHVKRALEVAAAGGHNVLTFCPKRLHRRPARPLRLRAGSLPPASPAGS